MFATWTQSGPKGPALGSFMWKGSSPTARCQHCVHGMIGALYSLQALNDTGLRITGK